MSVVVLVAEANSFLGTSSLANPLLKSILEKLVRIKSQIINLAPRHFCH